MRLESTLLFMEQLQPYENLRNYFHIMDSLKAQLGLCVKNTIELSSPPSPSPIKKFISLKRGRPLLLGALDEKVQNFLVALRSKVGVVNTIVTVAVPKALIEKSVDETLLVLDLGNSSWAKVFLLEWDSLKELSPLPGQRFPKVPERMHKILFISQSLTGQLSTER